jgi:hypothetical protein
MVNSSTRHAHAPCAAARILLNGARRVDALDLLRATASSGVDQSVRSAYWCRRNGQIELKNCSTEFPANEPSEMYRGEADRGAAHSHSTKSFSFNSVSSHCLFKLAWFLQDHAARQEM